MTNPAYALFGATPPNSYPLPLPTTDPDEIPLVYVSLNREWLAYLIGLCYPLRMENAWDSTDVADVNLAIARANLLIEMLMTLLCDPLCIDGLRLAGNTLQYSPDGGSTWVDINNAGQQGEPQDPRLYEPLLPVRSGSDKRCLASANAVAVFVELHREIVAWYNDNISAIVFLGAISAILAVLFPVSWAVFGIAVATQALITSILLYTDALTNESFTAEIQARLACILYQYADANGQWTSSDLDNILITLGTETGDMWRLLELYLEQIGGFTGLNNAGTTTSVASYDCSECAGYCYYFDFRVDDYGWTPVSLYNTCVYTPGVGFVGSSPNYNTVFATAAFATEDPLTEIASMWMTIYGAGNRSGAQINGTLCWNDGAGSQGYKGTNDGNTPGPATTVTNDITGTIATMNARAQIGGPGEETQTGTVTLQSLVIYSNTEIPDFAGNECP